MPHNLALPETAMNFLVARAKINGFDLAMLSKEENLLRRGALDSFALMEVVVLLEEAAHKRVPASDLTPVNFDTLAKIEAYWRRFNAEA